MKKINIGITGATGSLGKVIIKNNKKISFIRLKGDIRNRKAVFDWFKKSNFNIVLHLAAIVPIKQVNRNITKAREVNYNGTKNIVDACIKKKLNTLKLEWDNQKSLCIVLCSNGYPEEYKKNIQIKNLDKIILDDNEYIFHAGTKKSNSIILSDGGRVLNFVIKSNNFKSSRNKIVKLIDRLNWENGFYRKDIGYKVID